METKTKYIAVVALSLDGKIAPEQNADSNWTSSEDKTFLHSILDKCDLIIVGRKTYEIAEKPLSKRKCIVLSGKSFGFEFKNENLTYCNPTEDLKGYIKEKKYHSVVILGGAQTYTYCLENKMIDEIFITIEPLTFGTGLPLFDQQKPKMVKWLLLSSKQLNPAGALLLHYQRID
jgi:dihydrofolate reductase